MLELLGLFFSAFVASTLLPGGSEIVLALMAKTDTHSAPVLLAVATAGNTLGAMTSWVIGLLARNLAGAPEKMQAALTRLRRFGPPVLLLSWVPIIGDPLCVAAGWLRVHWATALVYIAIGKAARYSAVLWVIG
ncbi:MAG: YqaA family protein [Pseudomonadota bacterium]